MMARGKCEKQEKLALHFFTFYIIINNVFAKETRQTESEVIEWVEENKRKTNPS